MDKEKKTRRDPQQSAPKLVKTVFTDAGPKLLHELPKVVPVATQQGGTQQRQSPATSPPSASITTLTAGKIHDTRSEIKHPS